MISVRVLGHPVRVFYRDPRVLPELAGLGSPHELLEGVSTLVSGISGETSNLSFTLSNRARQCTRLFTRPPIGAAVEVRDRHGMRFVGNVQGIDIDGPVCTVAIETRLARPLPLRVSTIWGGFRTAVPLPHRYGQASGELIQYNEARTLFCWADHACVSVDEVLSDDQPAGGWQFRTLVDSSNHAITVVEFNEPQPEGSRLIARGRGKRHPVSGNLMTNPAAVIWDVLANIEGWSVTESQLDAFRRECDLLGIEVGGSIESTDTAQAVARSICDSIGGAFCADAPDLCRILAGAAAGASRLTVRDGVVKSVVNDATLCNDLTVLYGFESGQPSGSVQLDAPDYIARDGQRAETLSAYWISSSRVAYAVAARILSERARPQWVVNVSAVKRPLNVFDPISLAHAELPVSGVHLVRSREVDLAGGVSNFTVSVPAGDPPAVRLVRQAIAYAAQQYVGATQQVVGTDRIYTITEADGRPVVGAAVTANTFTRYTDAAGRVAFPISALPAGSYVFQIVALDGRAWPYPVIVV